MKKRYVLLAGLAAGFVLGSRSGRQTYDKLKSEAEKVWNSPDVQAGVQQVTETVREQGPEVAEKIQDSVRESVEKVRKS